MAKQQKKSENLVIDFSFRVIMATVKAMLVYLIYFLLALMLVSLFRLIPGFLESIGAFIAVYIAFMILSDLTAKTVFQYFFKTRVPVIYGALSSLHEKLLNQDKL